MTNLAASEAVIDEMRTRESADGPTATFTEHEAKYLCSLLRWHRTKYESRWSWAASHDAIVKRDNALASMDAIDAIIRKLEVTDA